MAISPIKSHELREVAEFAVAEIKKSVALFDEAVQDFHNTCTSHKHIYSTLYVQFLFIFSCNWCC